jgi:general secretion pathway protein D
MKSKVLHYFIWLVLAFLFLSGEGFAQSEEPTMAERIRQAQADELVNIDFTEVEVRNLVKFISEVTGKNFVMDEELKGKVTIVSPQSVTIAEAYKVFESVLEVHGYTVVPSGKAYKIIPIRLARMEGVDTTTGMELRTWPPGERIITQIVHLQYAIAEDLKQLLITLISPDSSILSYEPTNSLIITDSMSNVARLLEVIKEIDREGTQTQVVRIPLVHATAEVVADEILELLGDSTTGKSRVPSGGRKRSSTTTDLGPTLRIVSDARTNSLLVLAPPNEIEGILELAGELDIEMTEKRGGYHVYRLKHAVAEDVAKVLNDLISREKTRPGGQQQQFQPSLSGSVYITHDQATNSILIQANYQDYQRLHSVVEKLDIERTQVMVEALLVEATIGSLQDIGLEWKTVEEPMAGSYREFGGTNFGSYTNLSASVEGTTLPEGFFFGLTKGFLSSGAPNIAVLLRAFQEDQRINIISTPHLLTLDNEEAEIIVGQEVPYQTSFTLTQQSSEVLSFDYRDVGVILRLTPHISVSDILRMKLFVQIKDLITSPAEGELPQTTKREVTTSVIVEDGNTILIGGLLEDTEVSGERKVPCLGDIPLLGNLFKRFFRDKAKTNLLIFITPHIVRTPEDLEKLSKERGEAVKEKIEKSRSKKPFYLIDDE